MIDKILCYRLVNMRWMIVNLSNGVVLRYCNHWDKCQFLLRQFRSYPNISEQEKQSLRNYFNLSDSAFIRAENIEIIPARSRLIWSEKDRKFTHMLVSTLRKKAREGKLEEILDPTRNILKKGQKTLQFYDPMEREELE